MNLSSLDRISHINMKILCLSPLLARLNYIQIRKLAVLVTSQEIYDNKFMIIISPSLIRAGLIDEFHLFINPVAIGKGMTIFKDLNEIQKFNLVKSVAFDCGIIGLHYEPKREN